MAIVAIACILLLAEPSSAQQDVVRFDEHGREIRLGVGKSKREIANEKKPWTLQLKRDTTVQTTVVRVGDVVHPVAVPAERWAKLSQSTIGLVPSDGRPLRLKRYRLAEALSQSPLVDAPILWVGSESMTVKSSPVAQTSVQTTHAIDHTHTTTADYNTTILGTPPTQGAVKPVRLTIGSEKLTDYSKRLIERVVSQAMLEAKDEYRYEIDWQRVPVAKTNGIRVYERVSVPQQIVEGTARFVLTARVGKDTRQVPVHLEVTSLPRAIAAVGTIRRGQIISESDLKVVAVSEKDERNAEINDIKLVVGQEAKRTITQGRFIQQSDIGPPILVRRGDLIEIVVAGGAVVVRTSGKAISDGAEGQLVQVETLEKRKRLLARVIASGQVEIVTRAPQVQR